jgi:hypothetical protein
MTIEKFRFFDTKSDFWEKIKFKKKNGKNMEKIGFSITR